MKKHNDCPRASSGPSGQTTASRSSASPPKKPCSDSPPSSEARPSTTRGSSSSAGPSTADATPIPDTGRIQVHQNNTRYEYQTETIAIGAETTLVGILDTPDALPPNVQDALDLIARHAGPIEGRPNGRPIEHDTSTTQ